MPLALRYAARSDVGVVRPSNEDSGYGGAHVLVVADGMGGHAAGELASATAVAVFAELDLAGTFDDGADDVLAVLTEAVDDAHGELAQIVAESPNAAGLGTTVTALVWLDDRLALAHIGDSRAYLLRNGQLHQLTKDHTFVQSLVDSGAITRDEAAVHAKRNLLTRALDGMHQVDPDVSMREVEAGDRFLLCTDGLSGVLSDDDIQALLTDAEPTAAVTALVDLALERGAPDNVTCVVADVVDVPALPSTPSPVVVGAAADPRNREKLPGLIFPSDSEPDRDHDGASSGPGQGGPGPFSTPGLGATEGSAASGGGSPSSTAANGGGSSAVGAAPPRTPGRRRGWILPTAIAGVAALIVLGLLAGMWSWARSQYYVGPYGSQLAIFRGLSQGPAAFGLRDVVQTSPTTIDELPTYDQELVQNTIAADSLEEAEAILASLQSRAAECKQKPIPEGCPQPSAGVTPSPSPVPKTSASPGASTAAATAPWRVHEAVAFTPSTAASGLRVTAPWVESADE